MKQQILSLFLLVCSSLSLVAALEQREQNAIKQYAVKSEHYPEENPYLFMSTIHNPVSLPDVDHLACVARDFNHGVLIGLFRFRSNEEWDAQVHDWHARAEAILDAVNTDRIQRAVRERVKSQDNIDSLRQIVCDALAQSATNCEHVLFQEEYQKVNGCKEAFASQLDLHRAQGCAVAGRLIVAMRCLHEQAIVNCHLSTTETSFFACDAAEVCCYKHGSSACLAPCEPQMFAEGFVVPEEWGNRMYTMLMCNVRVAMQTFAKIAVAQQWMEPTVSNPTVMGVDVERLRRVIAQR